MVKCRIRAFDLALLLVFFLPTHSLAQIYVDIDATGPHSGQRWEQAYTSLKRALDEARNSSGPDEIWVAEGTYYPDEWPDRFEDDRNESFEIEEGITVRGRFDGTESAADDRELTRGVNVTTLSGEIQQDGNGANNAYHVVVQTGGTLEGVRITGGNANGTGARAEGGGLRITSGTIRRSLLQENSAQRGAAIYATGAPTLRRLLVSDNTAHASGAVYLESDSTSLNHVTVGNNSVNEPGAANAIQHVKSDATVTNSAFGLDASNKIQSSFASTVPTGVDQPLPGRYYTSMAWDPIHKRVLVYGGYDSRTTDDLYSYEPRTGAWTKVDEGPTLRSHTAVIDSVQGQMLVFGGNSGAYGHSMQNDIWSFDLETHEWTVLDPGGERPQKREWHAAVFAPERRAMFVFGGMTGSKDDNANDLWVYRADEHRWEERHPTGGPPPERRGHSAVWDAEKQRMLVYGGWDNFGPRRSAVWSYNAGENHWREIQVQDEPPGRFRHGAGWDSERRKMYIYGGCCQPGRLGMRIFDARSNSWTHPKPDGPTPPARNKFKGQAVWDPIHRSLLAYGGSGECTPLTDLWAFSPRKTRWTNLSSPRDENPIRASDHGSAVVDGKIYRFGGCAGGAPTNRLARIDPETGTAEYIRPSGKLPSKRSRHELAAAPSRGELFLFGGSSISEGSLNDLWKYSLNAKKWTALDPSGPAPEVRKHTTLVWNPDTERFLLFGGENSTSADGREAGFLDDLWAYDPAENRWIALEEKRDGKGPPPRANHLAAWDPANRQLLIYSGWFQHSDGSKVNRKDLWAYSPASDSWTKRSDGSGSPPHRVDTHLVWDKYEERALLFGGRKFPNIPGDPLEDDLWAFDPGSGTWTQLAQDAAPPGRKGHGFLSVSSSQDLILFGGYGSQEGRFLADVWRFDPVAGTWTQVR